MITVIVTDHQTREDQRFEVNTTKNTRVALHQVLSIVASEAMESDDCLNSIIRIRDPQSLAQMEINAKGDDLFLYTARIS